MPGAHDKLTVKQAAFVREYLANGRNAAQAYRKAYDPKAKNQRAAEQGHILLRNSKIAPIVAAAQDRSEKAIDRALTRYQITQEGLINRLARLADFDIRDVAKWTADGVSLTPSDEIGEAAAFAITELRQGPNGVSLKMADKRAALMDIAKLRGWLVDRGQMLGADGLPVNPGGPVFVLMEK